MMRFHKDRNSILAKGDENSPPPIFPPMTVCFSVLSQCFFVLHTLSPSNDLAELNVHRIHAIVESIDTVSTYATPIDDLLLCAAAQLTFSLQTVGQSLQPFF